MQNAIAVLPDAPPAVERVIVACTEEEAAHVRPLVTSAYAEARLRRWPFLSDVLAPRLRGVTEEHAAIVTAAVHGLVKYDRRLAFATGTDDVDARFDALFATARGDDGEARARIERIASPSERLGVAYSFPDWVVDRLVVELGVAAAERALHRMNGVAPRVLRANALKGTRDTVIAALAAEGIATSPAAHAPLALVVGGRRSPFRTEAFARGDFEMQDEASQLVADLVAPPPRSFVLDACAGAGGKTLALAALLGGKGKLVAIDTSAERLEELRRRARRAGASNVQAIAGDLLAPDAVAPGSPVVATAAGQRERAAGGPGLAAAAGITTAASRVLLDAPCSGLGAIRRNPEARWRLLPADMDRLAGLQRGLLRSAAPWVAPHGRVVYAVCSFLPSEGERVIAEFLAERRDFVLVTARDVLGRRRGDPVASADGRFLSTWRFDSEGASPFGSASTGAAPGADSEGAAPGADSEGAAPVVVDSEGAAPTEMDGFFAAVLRRVDPSGAPTT